MIADSETITFAPVSSVQAESVDQTVCQPRSVSETGVSRNVLEDLALKVLYLSSSLSIVELAKKMRLSYEVAQELSWRLRANFFCEVTGMSDCNVSQLTITSEGRQRATDLLDQNQYAGPAPVSLEGYVRQTRRQSVRRANIHAEDVQRAFAGLVLDRKTLRQFGTALNSGSSIFLYGPPGVGKTTIAETMSRVNASDNILLPYAIEVDGQIITVYDSSIHKQVAETGFIKRDERWVLCQRPAVLSGGELTAEMLDLQFNPVTRFYDAPAQMKANNGVLVIDDFGRQRIRPEELLNRWVVPLDRKIDFLTLAGGKKIEVPFEMLVVFASNMDPAKLVDPCFLRRIQTKIKIGGLSDEQFCEIFRRVTEAHHLEYAPDIPTMLIQFIRGTLKKDLRQCYPRDIVNQVLWNAQYESKEPYLDHDALMQALEAYFLCPKPD